MILQCNPPIPVWVPSRAQAGTALFLIDYSQEHDTLWVVGLADGTIWSLPQSSLRLQENLSLGRERTAPSP